MALDSPLLWRRRILAAVAETTTGTAQALTATDGAMNVLNHELEEDSPFNDRPGQGSLSHQQPVNGEEGGHANFAVELANDGAANTPFWATTLLPGCGMVSASGVWTPQTAAQTTLTIGLYNDGRLKQIAGAQGSWNAKLVDGKIGMMEFKFLGKWVAPTSVAMIAPTYPTNLPPKCTGLTVTIGGTNYRLSEVEIDYQNTVMLRRDMNDATGYHAAFIVERKVVIKMDPEALPLSTKDWYDFRSTQSTAAFSGAIGSGTHNQITFSAPVCSLANPVKDKDANGTLRDELVFYASRNSSAGDDELTITFS